MSEHITSRRNGEKSATDRGRPASSCLSTRAALEAHLAEIEAAGGTVLRDPTAGVLTASDPDGAVILRAIRKGRRGHWILMVYDSAYVTWQPTEPRP
jgi:hypothetical protein